MKALGDGETSLVALGASPLLDDMAKLSYMEEASELLQPLRSFCSRCETWVFFDSARNCFVLGDRVFLVWGEHAGCRSDAFFE